MYVVPLEAGQRSGACEVWTGAVVVVLVVGVSLVVDVVVLLLLVLLEEEVVLVVLLVVVTTGTKTRAPHTAFVLKAPAADLR